MAGSEAPGPGDITLSGLDWALTINGKTGEFEYVGSFERMLSEFGAWRSVAAGS